MSAPNDIDLHYYAFDLLHLDGFDTRTAPLIERKRVLQCRQIRPAKHVAASSDQLEQPRFFGQRSFRYGVANKEYAF
jgi:ATP-dependent DNA ligase